MDARKIPGRVEAVRQITDICKPEWIYGRLLPAYVGSETDARLSAIKRVLRELEKAEASNEDSFDL